MDSNNFNNIVEKLRMREITSDEAKALFNVLKNQETANLSQQRDNYGHKDRVKLGLSDIAIIGISGQFPDANDVNEFWNNLTTKHSAIQELPSNYLRNVTGEYYKWGGILKERNCFDPLFFNISPREAESMNPHQRLILQESWKALEDAGYNPRRFANMPVGIFIGAEPTGYIHESFTGASDAIIASRLSYYLDLKGAAMVVNTGCSSSALAIHLACESLRSKESSLAIAGGVFAKLDPSGLLRLSQIGMLSPTGSCNAFDESADGTVLAEGVGIVVLKRLEEAIADSDHIYGVIKGSGVNQDGASNGITAPNGIAQEQLITSVYKRFNINPEDISYIEAHGTSTKLGDPVEANALVRAFKHFTGKTGYCAIGSAKSYIGHTAAAAGVIGLIKILLSLRYHKIPGINSFKKLNPLIELDKSAFYISTDLLEWKSETGKPLMAALNSFGHSGTNVHIVIEECIPTPRTWRSSEADKINPVLIPISAKTEDCLLAYAQNLLMFLKRALPESETIIKYYQQNSNEVFPKVGTVIGSPPQEKNIENIAYTLQVGREAMQERVIFLVQDIYELIGKLEEFTAGKQIIDCCWKQVGQKKNNIRFSGSEEDRHAMVENLIAKRVFDKIAELWVQGYSIDWNMLYGKVNPSRISLPAYPFAKEHYWMPDEVKAASNPIAFNNIIHPLIHQNTSDLSGQRFSSYFTGQEFFLADHVVKDQLVLPGVATLEMARTAVYEATRLLTKEPTIIRLRNVGWVRPIVAGNGLAKVHVALSPEDNGEIAYEIYSESEETDSGFLIHSRGGAMLSPAVETEALDIAALQAKCNKRIIDGSEVYDAFKVMGVALGPAYRGVKKVYVGDEEILAQISLPLSVQETKDKFVLHPSMLDSSLQASLALRNVTGDAKLADCVELDKPVLPFSLEEIEIHSSCPASMWSLVRFGKNSEGRIQKLDADLCDENGNVCVRVRGVTSRVLEGAVGSVGLLPVNGTLMLKPCWQEQSISQKDRVPASYGNHLVLLCELNDISKETIETQINGVRCITLKSQQAAIEQRFETLAVLVFEEIKNILKNKPKDNVLVQLVIPAQDEQELFVGLSGLLKTAHLENPRLIWQLILIENKDTLSIIEKLRENSWYAAEGQIRYCDRGKRWVTAWDEVKTPLEPVKYPWKDKGIYLITGGVGGLGLIFAKEIASKVKDATLLLTGRSTLDTKKQAVLDDLRAMGARVEYKAVDVTQSKAVNSLIQNVKEKFGNVHGIIHSAGIIQDNFIIRKTKEELQEVIAPKVRGLINLDHATKDLELDFFILFSSIAGGIGNPGQADYSTANAFMDVFAKYRNTLAANRLRYGQTLSINWPLWNEGGMHIDKQNENRMRQTTGMAAINTSSGILALYQSLASGHHQVMVVEGELRLLRETFFGQYPEMEAVSNIEKGVNKSVEDQDMFRQKTIQYLKQLLSSVIKLPVQRIEESVPMEKYGIDSIMVMQLTAQLEKTFGLLPKTLFFEYQNIQELAEYFLESYRKQLEELIDGGDKAAPTTVKEPEKIARIEEPILTSSRRRQPVVTSLPSTTREAQTDEALDIAIIGCSGRYPQAKNIGELWKNIRDGKDSITEIPSDRWDYRLYYDIEKNKQGKTYCKWGGFIEGVDQFDPLFFNISPQEAETLDPQERLFLQCVYETLEDAGYTRDSLGFDLEGNVGVYVGVMYDEYQLYGVKGGIKGSPAALPGYSASVANRISYFCNFSGPSMAIDTMCSSSLTAIHLACQSIRRGECKAAVAGGVNFSIHPNKYLLLAQKNFVSSKGRCESFGQDGDGFVPGEGVGAVLLKPLARAIADRDHIYGVIKATAINHGGKTNGYTVPNPNAQARVICMALREAGINPRTISYLEAHGTGTALGDPIEIASLTKAFREYTGDKQFCSIGSVKSNIGHCESAAGIAAVTKVLLQLKYCQLVPSLHSKALNSNIDFIQTPFKVQQELASWNQPEISINGKTKKYPRIAGVSSFGAGGSNAHVVIEEYRTDDLKEVSDETTQSKVGIVLSAKNEDRLKERVQLLLTAIQEKKITDNDLINMAYTLQIGREAMEERLAIVADSIKELEEKLTSFLAEQEGIEELYRGQVKRNKESMAVFAGDEDMAKTIEAWIIKRKYTKLLELWTKGLMFDWNKLYNDCKPSRISLPTYPFARERYWVSGIEQECMSIPAVTSPISSVIHLLLHRNTSDFSEQRFSSIFTGKEFFFADYLVAGQPTLPETACLEMVLVAIRQSTGDLIDGQAGIHFKNVIWARAITIGETAKEIHIGLYLEGDGEFAYEIYSLEENLGERVVYSQGIAIVSPVKNGTRLDINTLQAQCNYNNQVLSQYYETFRALGIEYGSAYRGIVKIYASVGMLLAKIALPACISDTSDQFSLHPSIMDSALQAARLLIESNNAAGLQKWLIPLNIDEVEIIEKCASSMWAVVKYRSDSQTDCERYKADIDLCDEQGSICVRMKGVSFTRIGQEMEASEKFMPSGQLLFEPSWKEKDIGHEPTVPSYTKHLVILCGTEEEISRETIETNMTGVQCLVLQSQQNCIEDRFQDYAVQLFQIIQSSMRDKKSEKTFIQFVVPLCEEQRLFSGLIGLLHTARLENPHIIGQLVEIENCQNIIRQLTENSCSPLASRIRYQNGKRLVAGWSEVLAVPKTPKMPWKDRGIYLITGGAGGLGLIYAKEIARNVREATIILTGRSELNSNKCIMLEELNAMGARAEYLQVDVGEKNEVINLILSIQKKFGSLNGIIHSAGVIRDNFILKKTKEEILEVLRPKVTGLANLDQASKDLELDFFVLFSSLSGSFGNTGQADYSAANAFMDVYAEYRNILVAAKQRQGQTLSINWPLWEEGGMHINEVTAKIMMENTGLSVMKTSTGIQTFYQSLALTHNQIMIVEGNLKQIRETLFSVDTKPILVAEAYLPQVDSRLLHDKTLFELKGLLGRVTKLGIDKIDADEPLETYGIDSVMITQLNNWLTDIFGELSKTLFFEYQTLGALAKYLIDNYAKECIDWTGLAPKANTVSHAALVANSNNASISLTSLKAKKKKKDIVTVKAPQAETREPIAVIGMSGRYPQAKNLQEYWRNLSAGEDCISLIPNTRWSLDEFFHPDPKEAVAQGKSYCKWGGFIEDVTAFDPLFFNISPREAITMDPQERLFIETCWEVIEDAGYTREQLATEYKGRIGVFAGITKTGYELYGTDLWRQGEKVFPHTSFSSVANRVSYLLNLHGPSMPIDTMCSSSLTAIHEACQHLYRQECDMAIAGGVNLYLHSSNYNILCANRMLSSDGRCKSFGINGNGFVPGEGVGGILLKRLSQAIADKDHIYALIRSTSINHGGKTNGYIVPNPVAQGNLIRDALDKARVNARTISYIEAHGTGTELGDPIEISGLVQAFEKDTQDREFCAIGSVKSNIGHLEAAAGIAGITKVILQMNNQKLVSSLHAENLNSNINFPKTPFVVQRELSGWKRPVVTINGEIKEYPRIAGISSFGAGGANAHVIVEEYVPEELRPLPISIDNNKPVIILLSARNEIRLREQAKRLLTAMRQQNLSDTDLVSIAYTLQIGREAMEERLGLVVRTMKELEQMLESFVEGVKDDQSALYRGQTKSFKDTVVAFSVDENLSKTIDDWITKEKYDNVLSLWVKGLNINWNKLYSDGKPQRISLPAYPFAKEHYWLPEINTTSAGKGTETSTSAWIHPVLHQNNSDFYAQRFSSLFTGREFFLTDHVVNDKRVLPGVTYLEMAREAVIQSFGNLWNGKNVIQLKNVVWNRPVIVEEQPVKIYISLSPEEGGEITYEIYSESETANAELVIHSQGSAELGSLTIPTLDLSAIKSQVWEKTVSATQCYEIFRIMGINYGPGHQGIKMLNVGANYVLAELSLPVSVAETKDMYIMHPSMLDSALQAASGLMMNTGDLSSDSSRILKQYVPFAVDDIKIFGKCSKTMWALIRYSDGSKIDGKIQKLDIDLCDDNGTVCVRMRGLSFREMERSDSIAESNATVGMQLICPCWKQQVIDQEVADPVYNQHLVILCEFDGITPKDIENQISNTRCLSLLTEEEGIEARFQIYATQVFEEIQSILRGRPKEPVLLQVVIPDKIEQQVFSGLSGMLKTAMLENPIFIGQIIEIESGENAGLIVEKLKENSRISRDNHIRYQDGKRWCADWSEVQVSPDAIKIPWKYQGIYLITGGTGGLGQIFAKEIAQQVKKATLILTGRRPLTEDKQALLQELVLLGAKVEYQQVDVSNKEQVVNLIKSIREKFGNLHGIIHCAGILKDSFILKKSSEDVKEVLAPKVSGLVNLDQASRDLPLEFFILFSSLAGVIGNPGQADYATANAFMDAYARYRNILVKSGHRQGHTLAINWPLWKEGGMSVDKETQKMMREKLGFVAMETQPGIQALYQAMASGNEQVVVMSGIRQFIDNEFVYANYELYHDVVTRIFEDQLTEEQFINLILR
ncbi:MAG TPA: SDR family NAD(P)-dependent oxidoreductase [Methylomusa anaerophila]|uniref:Polyketide synthase PksN n=1 Tax=Methylomusa anaerophila TaxID=1930071 RepID=A0A348AN90_9FIRM|nr:SDR family NAD(P)-dependent oxidoreductase [Methylomusa anaerophila]BBB92538.1 polyketide synthase PksN [Methylomusa anaerophila]HML87607.1 SDR family NAD(P)-dependent oxidoreductase [Methylomusa anaerophila]